MLLRAAAEAMRAKRGQGKNAASARLLRPLDVPGRVVEEHAPLRAAHARDLHRARERLDVGLAEDVRVRLARGLGADAVRV